MRSSAAVRCFENFQQATIRAFLGDPAAFGKTARKLQSSHCELSRFPVPDMRKSLREMIS
jgi:hypothetical protein